MNQCSARKILDLRSRSCTFTGTEQSQDFQFFVRIYQILSEMSRIRTINMVALYSLCTSTKIRQILLLAVANS